MKYSIYFSFALSMCSTQVVYSSLSDYVAEALAENAVQDALFITKSLQINNNPELQYAYKILLRNKPYKGNQKGLDDALAQFPIANGINADQYKGHQGIQAVEDIINMFVSGPGAAVYKKLAPSQNKAALDTIVKAIESTKTMLN